MSKSIRDRITFSNVIAVIALFVALGGTAFAAAKISGKTIKPKTIPANRIKPNSLTSKQLKETSVNQAVTYVSSTLNLPADPGGAQPVGAATATCPAGLKAIGGGGLFTNPADNFIQDEGITPDHSGYTARAFPAGGNASTLIATAACVKVGT